MLKALLGMLAWLPLSWFHAVGILIGKAVYAASPAYAGRLRENLRRSGVCPDAASYERVLRRTVTETGKGLLELVPVWFRSLPRVAALVRECRGWEFVEEALGRGAGIVFMTPHLGCFEISALYIAQRLSITVLYRRPKARWLEPLMVAGRQRGHARVAPADLAGVRRMLKALKRGEAVGLLPDQAPGRGEGVWVDFFGRPAYTMTLAARLTQSSDATVLMVFARRLPWGRGYILSFTPLKEPLPREPVAAARAVNVAVEELVRQCPEQYLWSYNRYKVPMGVEPPQLRKAGGGKGAV
jgi:KDO2-lipid IV(A) lauroyltransferase